MADPSTANPSEPDPSANPHPENSHNTGNPDPSDTGQKPLDPTEILRQAASGEEDQKPQKLKLKQILTPLSPHLKAPRPKVEKRVESKTAYKPSPKAVPVEPEPELTPEELAAREKIMPPGESKESPEGESSPPVEGESSPEEDTADSQEEPNAEESGEVEPAKKPAATPAAPGTRRRPTTGSRPPGRVRGATSWLQQKWVSSIPSSFIPLQHGRRVTLC